MGYIIGSFNISKMNLRHNENSGKDFRRIAEIILSERFDIVALQEVLTRNALVYSGALKSYLGPDWNIRWAYSEGVSHGAAEGYAYLWNKRRINLVSEPQIYDRKGARGKFVRPPFLARFSPSGLPGGSFFEIRLINTHVAYGKPDSIANVGEIEYRRQEIRTLAEETYSWFSTRGYGNNMPSYTIMLGDYNLCLSGDGPKLNEIIPISETRFLRTTQHARTSLKKPVEEPEFDPGMPDEEAQDTEVATNECEWDHYSRNYDHFSYETTLDDRATILVSRVEALGKYYNNELANYRKEISDHVPIKLELNLRTRG